MMKGVRKWIAYGLIWWLCAFAAVAALLWMAGSFLFGSGRRGWRIAIALDQAGNATAAGDEDEVFSSRCWRLRNRRPYSWLQPGIDRAFLWARGERDHCRGAWEAEEAKCGRGLEPAGGVEQQGAAEGGPA